MILAFNAGSSTLKFGCYEAGSLLKLATGLIDWSSRERTAIVLGGSGEELVRRRSSTQGYRVAALEAIRILQETQLIAENGSRSTISAVGHRVVHGGTKFQSSVALDPAVKAAIGELSDLAPLHNPPALEVIEAAEESLVAVPQVAVFDTAFFSDLPARSHIYPLPYEWFAEWGIRRFGFHGISHSYCTGRAGELIPGQERRNLVICHLGNGCSATAVRDGKAIATTMGFTPLEGLMMGSRSGSIDPGILVYLQTKKGLTAESVGDVLNHKSGLLGVSGISGNFREVEQAAKDGNRRARLALDIYVDRVRAAIGSLAVALGAVDALIFTGGVGENSAALRAAVCDGLQCLGIHLDPARNDLRHGDRNIAAANSRTAIWIIHTQEEVMIAREALRIADERGSPRGQRRSHDT
jgi:acetate kinase